MKKKYTQPNVELNILLAEEVVRTSPEILDDDITWSDGWDSYDVQDQ